MRNVEGKYFSHRDYGSLEERLADGIKAATKISELADGQDLGVKATLRVRKSDEKDGTLLRLRKEVPAELRDILKILSGPKPVAEDPLDRPIGATQRLVGEMDPEAERNAGRILPAEEAAIMARVDRLCNYTKTHPISSSTVSTFANELIDSAGDFGDEGEGTTLHYAKEALMALRPGERGKLCEDGQTLEAKVAERMKANGIEFGGIDGVYDGNLPQRGWARNADTGKKDQFGFVMPDGKPLPTGDMTKLSTRELVTMLMNNERVPLTVEHPELFKALYQPEQSQLVVDETFFYQAVRVRLDAGTYLIFIDTHTPYRYLACIIKPGADGKTTVFQDIERPEDNYELNPTGYDKQGNEIQVSSAVGLVTHYYDKAGNKNGFKNFYPGQVLIIAPR
jgi:hypothetical protein